MDIPLIIYQAQKTLQEHQKMMGETSDPEGKRRHNEIIWALDEYLAAVRDAEKELAIAARLLNNYLNR